MESEAIALFEAGSYSTDLRPMVLKLVVKRGGKEGWDKIMALYTMSGQ